MDSRLRISTFVLATMLTVACGTQSRDLQLNSSATNECDGATIKEKIENCLEGVQIVSGPTSFAGFDKFVLHVTQATDHSNLDGETFEQRVVLYHKSEDRPMVLYTSGYNFFGDRISEPTRLLGSNQLYVEHRFFDPSRPDSEDWQYLNIKQSADDFHRITMEFKKIYGEKWLNTGGSKGGMTSVYHRRFYPDDMDATVPYVAPLSFSDEDARYVDFLADVGGDRLAACRDRLNAMRIEVMKRKGAMAGYLRGNYGRFGGKVAAVELMASEMYFIYFQYSNPRVTCASIPGPDASNRTLFDKFDEIVDADFYADDKIEPFVPYFYQAATQLGAPKADTEAIGDLIDYPDAFAIGNLMPQGVTVTHDPAPMIDVDRWVKDESETIMFVYGEYDPWTAGAFDPGSSLERDSHFYMAPAANHGAKLSSLNSEDYAEAIATLERWMGVDINIDAIEKASEPSIDRRSGLRP